MVDVGWDTSHAPNLYSTFHVENGDYFLYNNTKENKIYVSETNQREVVFVSGVSAAHNKEYGKKRMSYQQILRHYIEDKEFGESFDRAAKLVEEQHIKELNPYQHIIQAFENFNFTNIANEQAQEKKWNPGQDEK